MTKKRITSIFMVVSIIASLFTGSISVNADELPLISAESVSSAILSDAAGISEEVCTSNEVAAQVQDGNVEVIISTTDLKMHKNGENNDGYWTGFSVVAPEGATKMKAALGTSEDISLVEVISVEENVSGENDGIAFYLNAGAANPKKYAKLQWFDESDNALCVETVFEIDLSGVTLDNDYTPNVVEAIIQDSDDISSEIYDTYEVSVSDDNVVTINMTALESHTNGEGNEGYWTGFAITAPENATKMKAGLGTTADITLDTFIPVEENVSEENNGIAFYIDAGVAVPKKYAKLQWFNDSGVAISDEILFEIDLSNVRMNFDDAVNVVKATVTGNYETYEVLMNEGNVIDINMTALEAHINGEGNEGFWTGFAVIAPEGATKMKAVSGTSSDIELGSIMSVETAVATIDETEKSGVAFYVDTGAVNSKNYAKLQWFNDEEKALSNVTEFAIDISGVELSGLDKISAEAIGEAKIVNQNQTEVNPYSTYSVTSEQSEDIINVAINMTELKSHKNSADTNGYWTGFAVTAPEGAAQLKYVFDTEENASWTNAVLSDVEEDVSGENDGAAFYTNAGASEPKTVVMLQWFDENGNALSNVTTIKINLGAVSLYTEPVRTSSTGGGSTSLTVKFDTNGGSKIDSVRVYKNKMLNVPEIPEKEGFTFDGWYTDNTFAEKYDFTQRVTKSFTLYAKWIEKNDEPEKTEEPDEDNIEFTDIENDVWYYDVVKTAIEKGLMNGVSKTEFAPMMNLTRGMFVTVLYRAEGEPEVGYAQIFSDVDSDKYYANAVVWAAENGIVNGMSETEFMPDENITREQMAAIISRFIEYKQIQVTEGEDVVYTDDNNIAVYAKEAIKIAKWLGILEGNADGSFAPKRNATRAEAAAVFVRLLAVIQ